MVKGALPAMGMQHPDRPQHWPPHAEAEPEAQEEPEFQEGLLLGFDLGPAEHDLYYSNVKESLSAGDARSIRFVEFPRVSSTTPPYFWLWTPLYAPCLPKTQSQLPVQISRPYALYHEGPTQRHPNVALLQAC